MEKKDFINCSKCNLPIYPPKLQEEINIKDKFDQIRCLGCNTINSYTQSQEYKTVWQEQKKEIFTLDNFYGFCLIIFLISVVYNFISSNIILSVTTLTIGISLIVFYRYKTS